MSPRHGPPGILANLIWAISAAVTIPASLAALRIRDVTFDPSPQRPPSTIAPRALRRTGVRTGGIFPFLFQTFFFGFLFVVVDEHAGWDILYRAFGLDILPKTPGQLELRRQRGEWRAAKRSGDAARIRETFFRLRRERLDMRGVKYDEEPMEATPEEGKAGRLLDPADVRVFFIPSKTSAGVVSKVYMAFNADPDEDPEVREKVERATDWILKRQVEVKADEDCLEMPCRLLRVYQERFEGEHLLKWSRNEDGSSTLAEAWERTRPRFVAEVDVKPGE